MIFNHLTLIIRVFLKKNKKIGRSSLYEIKASFFVSSLKE
jgi:hypothetical protein